MPIRDYEATPSGNQFLSGIDVRETLMRVAATNDAVRQMMADTKELQLRATLASSSTSAIGAANAEVIDFTGSAVVNAFDNVGPGVYRELHITGAPTFKNNVNIIIPGGADIVAGAGDVLGFRSGAGGVWRLVSYVLATGVALVSPPAASLDAAKTGTNDSSMMTPAKVALVAGGPWVDLAAAATLDLGAQSSANIRLTGSGVTVTALGTAPSGLRRKLRLAGTTTFAHGANIVVQAGANVTLAADDTALATSLGGGVWFLSDIGRAGLASGAVLRMLSAQFLGTKAFASSTTISRFAAPAATDGNEIPELTLSITLGLATNKVRVQASVMLSAASPLSHTVAVFRNGTFVRASHEYTTGAEEVPVTLDFIDTPGAVGPHVYTFRVGNDGGSSNEYVNRPTGSTTPYHGTDGVASTSYLTELAA